MLVLPATQD